MTKQKKAKAVKTVEAKEAGAVASTKVFIGGGSLAQLNSHFVDLCEPPLGFIHAMERTMALCQRDNYVSFSKLYMNSRFLDLPNDVLRKQFERYMQFLESHGRAEKVASLDPQDQLWFIR